MSKHLKTLQSDDGYAIYKRLASYSLVHWKYLLLAFIGLILAGITTPLFTIYLQPLLDGTFTNKDPSIIRWAPFALFFIFFLRGVSSFLSSYSLEWVGRTVVKEIRAQLFDRFLRLPVSFYDRNNSGELVTRLIFHVEQVSLAATKGLTTLVQDGVVVIGSIAVMFYHSFQLTLIIFIVAPIIAVFISYVSKRFRKLSRQIQNEIGEVTQIGHETINTTREIRIYDGNEYETNRFKEVNEKNHRSYMKRIITERLSMPIAQLIMAVALSFVVYLATHGSLIETFTAGSFTSFMMAMVALLDPVKRLANISATLQSGVAAGESIFSLLDEASEKDTGSKILEKVGGVFEFKNVEFYYDLASKDTIKQVEIVGSTKKTKVLDNISFSVKQGEKIALVGQSGSGKTTLVNLLPRFYDVTVGDITLDGVSLTEIQLQNLREQFAYVSQDVTLFNDSVRNNIAYGNMRNASDEQVKAAAEAAFALDFIERLPQGFDTHVGENGTLLSGGQKQRIAIARAILSDAPILILDEATSALDTKSERHIQAALDKLLENRTTFMIAHRLSTIEKADKIMMMEAGKIIETGTHQQLLKQKGAYYRLYQLQFEQE